MKDYILAWLGILIILSIVPTIAYLHNLPLADTSAPSVNSDMRKDEKHDEVQPEK